MRRRLIANLGCLTLAVLATLSLVTKSQTSTMRSSLTVLGVYSPVANRPAYEAFIDREVAARNPINFSAETVALFRRLGRADDLVALTPEELDEIRGDLERDLSGAALIEVLVSGVGETFSIGDFQQPNPKLPGGQWQVAWLEKFLTADGQALIDGVRYNELPKEEQYRTIFYIHDWKHENGLNGPYGPMKLPSIEPMPNRLWLLAPYEQVD